MAHSRPETANRAARKKLGGSFVAVVVLENGPGFSHWIELDASGGQDAFSHVGNPGVSAAF